MQSVGKICAARRAEGNPAISFEFFPSKTDEGDRKLSTKIGAGADFAIIQLFPDKADYYLFRGHRAWQHSVAIPLVLGIVPILSATQIRRFLTSVCGERIPAAQKARLEEFAPDGDAVAVLRTPDLPGPAAGTPERHRRA